MSTSSMPVTKVSVSEDSEAKLTHSKAITIDFESEGHSVKWETFVSKNSANTLIFNRSRKNFVFVKQFRAVAYTSQYFKAEGKVYGHLSSEKVAYEKGETLELCGGFCDEPELSPQQTAVKDVLKLTGYNVKADDFVFVTIFMRDDHIGLDYLYYVEVSDDQKLSKSPGLLKEKEFVTVEEKPAKEFAQSVIDDVDCSLSFDIMLKFACLWFIEKNKQFWS